MVRAISLINVPISNVVLKSGQIKSHEVAIQRKLRIDEISQKLGFMEKHQVNIKDINIKSLSIK